MTVIIEDDETPSGDAWAGIVAQDHSAEEQWLAEREREFLARGGVIRQVPQGLCGKPTEVLKYGALSTNDRYSPAEQMEMRTAKARDALTSRIEADEKAAAVIDVLLNDATTVLWITQCTGFSSDKVQRLLREYFGRDPRAQKFRSVDQQDRKANVLRAAKAAISSGQVGVANVAQASGASTGYIRKLMREEGLSVPYDTPGRKKGVPVL